jgi:hypothetical protein
MHPAERLGGFIDFAAPLQGAMVFYGLLSQDFILGYFYPLHPGVSGFAGFQV